MFAKQIVAGLRVVLAIIAVLCLLLGTGGFLMLFVFTSPTNVPPKELISILAIIALLIVLGVLLVYFAMRRMRKDFAAYQVSCDLRQANPTSPWLWREDWQLKTVLAKQYDELPFVLTIILCVLLATVFVAAIYYSSFTVSYTAKALLKSIFSAVAFLVVFFWAGCEIFRIVKFGRSVLLIETLPGEIGGSIRGTVVTRQFPVPKDGFTVKLICRKPMSINYRGEGKVIWKTDARIEEPGKNDEGGQTIRFAADLPAGVEETKIDPPEKISWWLQVRAAVNPINYAADFEVPVFKLNDR